MIGYALDTSVLIPLLADWHPAHEATRAGVPLKESALPAHVLWEAFSVLTRLPAPHRISPGEAAAVVEAIRLPVLDYPAEKHQGLIGSLGSRGVRGGAIYDALVGATAAHHTVTLLTMDRRAVPTYDAVGAKYRTV